MLYRGKKENGVKGEDSLNSKSVRKTILGDSVNNINKA
jgi:hypothetical protein